LKNVVQLKNFLPRNSLEKYNLDKVCLLKQRKTISCCLRVMALLWKMLSFKHRKHSLGLNSILVKRYGQVFKTCFCYFLFADFHRNVVTTWWRWIHMILFNKKIQHQQHIKSKLYVICKFVILIKGVILESQRRINKILTVYFQ